jgi:uncharacterized protein YceH (UPF0502 family)
MELRLNETELRVLGSLVEKESTTPDYYPLSLNALMNACNQRSNRDPVTSLDEEEVRNALDSLVEKRLVRQATSFDSRVPKYAHQLAEAFNFDRPETAVLCVLLLRGAQTPGELRSRADRMYSFDELATVESTLQHLIERDPPLVRQLSRKPGTKESRYVHLWGGEASEDTDQALSGSAPEPLDANGERISRLEDQVLRLEKEIDELKQDLAGFRKQCE